MTDNFNPLYDGLFYDWVVSEREPAAQNDIDRAEQRLGRKLPADYVQLLKYQNGGFVQKSSARSAIINGEPHTLGLLVIFGVGDPEGIDSVTHGKTCNQRWIEARLYPADSVVFAPQGSTGFAFDTRMSAIAENQAFCIWTATE